MSRCIIITAYNSYSIKSSIEIKVNDFVICADGGYDLAKKENIIPNVLIGDFDSTSCEVDSLVEVIRVPVEKDDTDTLLCLKYGIEKGYDEFVLVGGIGGRFDHTMANLQTLAYGIKQGKSIKMVYGENSITMIEGTSIKINKKEGYKLSLLSFSDECTGVSINNVKYPLNNAVLKNSFPIGVSNEQIDAFSLIENKSGKLLIIQTKD